MQWHRKILLVQKCVYTTWFWVQLKLVINCATSALGCTRYTHTAIIKTTAIQVQMAIGWRRFSSNGNYRSLDSIEIATDTRSYDAEKTRWLDSLIGAFYEITVEDMATKITSKIKKFILLSGEKERKRGKKTERQKYPSGAICKVGYEYIMIIYLI